VQGQADLANTQAKAAAEAQKIHMEGQQQAVSHVIQMRELAAKAANQVKQTAV